MSNEIRSYRPGRSLTPKTWDFRIRVFGWNTSMTVIIMSLLKAVNKPRCIYSLNGRQVISVCPDAVKLCDILGMGTE